MTNEKEKSGAGEHVILHIDGKRVGLPVKDVHDVLAPHKATSIPLSSEHILGAINLRGRIVTLISTRRILGLPGEDDPGKDMSAVVERDGHSYAFCAERIDEVIDADVISTLPPTLEKRWRDASTGGFKTDSDVIVLFDTDALLKLATME
jgi:purine-binding chemotaxis protein CheW